MKVQMTPEGLRTHAQKVCSLYKRSMRMIESYYVYRNGVRFYQVLLRAEFDKNRCECDPKEQRRLLRVGEHELFLKKYPIPLAKFATSIGIAGGVAFNRVPVLPDWLLDYWHPLEKAQYPEYFKKREQRKKEFEKLWNDGKIH